MKKAIISTIAKEYVRAVQNAGIPVQSAYIIGSQVLGTAHEGSDIDICIVSPLFGKNKHAEMMKLTKLRRGINVLIEPHPLSPQDIVLTNSTLSHAIHEHGIQIV
jgi:predicted nucleotidyltransferase